MQLARSVHIIDIDIFQSNTVNNLAAVVDFYQIIRAKDRANIRVTLINPHTLRRYQGELFHICDVQLTQQISVVLASNNVSLCGNQWYTPSASQKTVYIILPAYALDKLHYMNVSLRIERHTLHSTVLASNDYAAR